MINIFMFIDQNVVSNLLCTTSLNYIIGVHRLEFHSVRKYQQSCLILKLLYTYQDVFHDVGI
jgi:hypothetical protein